MYETKPAPPRYFLRNDSSISSTSILLSDRFTDLQFEEGDALAEAVLKPAQFLMRPLLDQAIIILRNQSLENWTQMSEEEIDALLSNFFFTREEGNLSAGDMVVVEGNERLRPGQEVKAKVRQRG